MNLVNKTPHPIHIANADGEIIRTIEPTPPPARVFTYLNALEPVDGIPVRETFYAEIENLPEPKAGTLYIVSWMTAQAASTRTDLVRPDTGASCVRDCTGRIVAVRGFTK